MDIKQKEGGIPPVLNIQLDNTTKQNKGRYLIAYLAYLVQQGVIKEAYCNFLPVGHTHEDIDQFFSRVSVFTRHHNAPDPEALRSCVRKSFKKYGRAPIVVGWDTVGNLSDFFKDYTHPNLSKDITLYYQLRVKMGRSGDIAGVPIIQARTWPGADQDDRSDFWRGLVPDTSYVRVFHNTPDLLGQHSQLPNQAQPHHIGLQAGTQERMEYTRALAYQRESVKRLMDSNRAVFGETHRANMLRLLDALASNLDPARPVPFQWLLEDMTYLYGEGQYVDHTPEPSDEAGAEPNLFNDHHVLADIQRQRPDGIRDAAGFAEDVDNGRINLQLVENVQSCMLRLNCFYMQRPAVLGNPFSLVKVVRVLLNENGTQWGAFVHPWEISTNGADVDYFKDPWHASGLHKSSQRYDPTKSMHDQAASWTYPISVLEEFQEEVRMNDKWSKPRDFKKPMHTGHGVKKRNLNQSQINRLRNFVYRWNEDEATLPENQ